MVADRSGADACSRLQWCDRDNWLCVRAGTGPADQWREAECRPLAYNIFRWYRSGWGRYTQADPIGLHGVTNVYHYTYSNPVRWTDPRGAQGPPDGHSELRSEPDRLLANSVLQDEGGVGDVTKYGSMQDDTESNALQHCYWNCCMAKAIGATEAKKCGDAHEEFKNNTQCKKTLDLFNNGVGHTVGAGKDCRAAGETRARASC